MFVIIYQNQLRKNYSVLKRRKWNNIRFNNFQVCSFFFQKNLQHCFSKGKLLKVKENV